MPDQKWKISPRNGGLGTLTLSFTTSSYGDPSTANPAFATLPAGQAAVSEEISNSNEGDLYASFFLNVGSWTPAQNSTATLYIVHPKNFSSIVAADYEDFKVGATPFGPNSGPVGTWRFDRSGAFTYNNLCIPFVEIPVSNFKAFITNDTAAAFVSASVTATFYRYQSA